jgi:hypothetical protein
MAVNTRHEFSILEKGINCLFHQLWTGDSGKRNCPGSNSAVRFEPAFTGDKGVCVSLGGIVGLCPVLGTGDHVPQETGQAGLDSDWQDGIGE